MNEFKLISVQSTLSIPFWREGHTDSHSVPCTVNGLYCERTGTLLLADIWCNQNVYLPADVEPEERIKFKVQLTEVIIDLYS